MLKLTKENWRPCYFTVLIANNKGADQTARKRRLVCNFVVRKQQSQGFLRRGLYDFETSVSLRACISILGLVLALVMSQEGQQASTPYPCSIE